jgi:hypothetical protein
MAILDTEKPVARSAIGYVSEIETGTPWGFQGLSSNEQDGMGMSLGVFQWNFGGSAQVVFQSISQPVLAASMPTWGEAFYSRLKSCADTALQPSVQELPTGWNGREASSTDRVSVPERWLSSGCGL